MPELRRELWGDCELRAVISLPRVFKNNNAQMAVVFLARNPRWHRDQRVFMARVASTWKDEDGETLVVAAASGEKKGAGRSFCETSCVRCVPFSLLCETSCVPFSPVAGAATVICTRDGHLLHPDVRAKCLAIGIRVLTELELLDELRKEDNQAGP